MKFNNNEVAIVTGGNKNIGAGISKILAKEGCRVVIATMEEESAYEVVNEIKRNGGEATYLYCDVSDEDAVKDLMLNTLKKYGKIDILINNAGIGGFSKVTETSNEEWDRCMDVDLKGVFFCCKYAIPYMQKNGKGSIINISSVHSIKSVNACAAYDAAKGAVSALTRQMAVDYGPVIRVNDVSPGWVHSDIVRGIFSNYDNPTAAQKSVEDRLLTKRIGNPEDIGYACAYVASDEASYMTGAQLIIDGGLTCILEKW